MMRGYLKVLVLKSLKEGEKTGYGLMKCIEEETGRKPSFGSIYPMLDHLVEEKLVVFKEKGKKKIYNLTKAGKEQLSCVVDRKEEMMDKIQEAVKIFTMVHGKDIGPYQQKMMDKMRTDHADVTDMPLEIMKMKEIYAELVVKNKVKANKAEINKILKKANQELKKLK